MTGQVGNLYCYVKDRIKLGTFAFVRLFVKLGLDKACPQLPGTLPLDLDMKQCYNIARFLMHLSIGWDLEGRRRV
jgi:hypothetical protein